MTTITNQSGDNMTVGGNMQVYKVTLNFNISGGNTGELKEVIGDLIDRMFPKRDNNNKLVNGEIQSVNFKLEK